MAQKYHLSSMIPYLQHTHPSPPPFAFTMAQKYHLSSLIAYLHPTHSLPPPFAFTMAQKKPFLRRSTSLPPPKSSISFKNSFALLSSHTIQFGAAHISLYCRKAKIIFMSNCIVHIFFSFFFIVKQLFFSYRSAQALTTVIQHHAYDGFSKSPFSII